MSCRTETAVLMRRITSVHSARYDAQGPIEKATRMNYGRAGIAPLARSWSCNHDQTIAEPAGEVCTPS